MSLELPIQLFVALFALYSPLSALSSYFPLVTGMKPADQAKLAFGLFTFVTIIGLTALWIGEPLLELLGISTEALTVTGGIALLCYGIPILRGAEAPIPKWEALIPRNQERVDWKSVVLIPVTFPLTVNGATFALFVASRAEVRSKPEVLALSVASLAYAALTGITLIASSHLERRVSWGTRSFLDRLSGIVLVATATMLILSDGPRMVAKALEIRPGHEMHQPAEGEVK
jgi:multiple antibiotic resistance protein